jgi:hypothetical protein
MKISLHFNKEKHNITLAGNAKLCDLNDFIHKSFGIPATQQKIIFKGKLLTAPMEPLVDGMKLLLIVADNSDAVKNTNPFSKLIRKSSPTAVKPTRLKPALTSVASKSINDNLSETSHKLITNKGLPAGFLSTSSKMQETMPSKTLYVRNTKGNRATFAFENNAIVSVDDNGEIEEIPLPLITDSVALPIRTHPGYFALGVMHDSTKKWFYFIPEQYKKLIMFLLRMS